MDLRSRIGSAIGGGETHGLRCVARVSATDGMFWMAPVRDLLLVSNHTGQLISQ